MGFSFKVGKVPITVANRKEAAALIREIAEGEEEPRRRNGKDVATVSPSGFPVAKVTLAFLNTVHGGGDAGVGTPRVLKAIGISSPKAFGNRGQAINNLLKGLGFDPQEVYTNDRNEKGDREWKSGIKMADAIEAVKKAAGG